MITKNTLQPYFYALLYLCALLIESILREILNEQDLAQGRDYMSIDIQSYSGSLRAITRDIIYTFKIICFTCFIGYRILSVFIKYLFMLYQSEFRLEELDIAKQEYQNLEVWVVYITERILLFFSCLLIILIVINDGILNHHPNKFVSLAYTYAQLISYAFCITLYVKYEIVVLFTMYNKHYLAFKTHVCKQVPLMLLTSISLSIFLCKEFYFMYWRGCTVI